MTQAPASLLHSDCMANVPVDSVTSPLGAPVIELVLHEHLSATSPPEASPVSTQAGSGALLGAEPVAVLGFVTVLAYSAPPTRLNPSSGPVVLTKFAPQAAPASGR